MLPQYSKLNEKQRIKELPELKVPQTVRLKFRKIGSLQYISHLDLQRTFNRVIVRACLPIWYTKGFNPHAKLVFSTPLSVGAQSICEYLDIKIDREMPIDIIVSRLNAELTDELHIIEGYIPTRDFSDIAWSKYEIEIFTLSSDKALAEKISSILTSSPINMTKKTKSGEKEIDITSYIAKLDTSFDESSSLIKISCTLSASAGEYLNPEMLISALKERGCVMCGDPSQEWYSITRTELLCKDFSPFK